MKLKLYLITMMLFSSFTAHSVPNKELSGKISEARFVCIPQFGHLAHLENQESFHQVLNEFFMSIEK